MNRIKNAVGLMLSVTILFTIFSTVSFAYTASDIPSYLFDTEYYSAKYEDLRKAFGNDKNKLYDHWCNFGIIFY